MTCWCFTDVGMRVGEDYQAIIPDLDPGEVLLVWMVVASVHVHEPILNVRLKTWINMQRGYFDSTLIIIIIHKHYMKLPFMKVHEVLHMKTCLKFNPR